VAENKDHKTTTGPTEAPIFCQFFGRYVWAVLIHWYTIGPGLVLAGVDGYERFRSTWLKFPESWSVIAALTILALAQFLAYRDSHLAHLSHLKTLQDEKDRENENRQAEKAALRQEIEKLKVKPYDRAQLELVEGKLRGLEPLALNVLKFLVQNGQTGRDSMDRALSFGNLMDGAVASLSSRLLIIPEDKPNIGRSNVTTFWRVNEQFEPVLRVVMFKPAV
jgi:hypothetical protein